MCNKKDMEDLFELLGFQETLINAQENKAEYTMFSILHNESGRNTKEEK